MYPKIDSLPRTLSLETDELWILTYSGLSKIFDILYSKFCAATVGIMSTVTMDILEGRNRQTERVDQISSVLSLESNDFTAGTSNVGVDIKCFPQVIYGRGTGHGTNIEEHTDIGLEDWAERIEEPSMGVDLLLVFLLETENYLDRNQSSILSFNFH